jgi:hypothetical protein
VGRGDWGVDRGKKGPGFWPRAGRVEVGAPWFAETKGGVGAGLLARTIRRSFPFSSFRVRMRPKNEQQQVQVPIRGSFAALRMTAKNG